MSFKSRAVFFLALFLSVGACTQKEQGLEDPKRRLNEYISQSFAVRGAEDRQVLAGYLTGDARRRLEAWSDEQFKDAFMASKRQFLKLVFKEVKTVSPTEVGITYELSYMDQGRGQAKVTNKKLAQMQNEGGKWLISDVRSLNELVEFKNEMSLP